MITQMEELGLNAWPALHTLSYDGWLCRFAYGYTSRANSVSPLYPGILDVATKIRYCEEIYRAREMPVIFKLTGSCQPPDLDRILAKDGYELKDLTSVHVLDLADFQAPALSPQLDAHLAPHYTEAWIEDFLRLINNTEDIHRPTMTRMLQNIVPKHAFLRLRQVNEVVGCGLAVVERGYVGLFDLVVDESQRGQGYGRQMIAAMLDWGQKAGATKAYLQVAQANTEAIRLYEELGFRELYRYWYRVKA